MTRLQGAVPLLRCSFAVFRVTTMIARTYPRTDIPELTDSQIKDILRNLDMQFNSTMVRAGGYGKRIQIHTRDSERSSVNQFSEGIYTGVVTVTLWAVGLYFSFLSDTHPGL